MTGTMAGAGRNGLELFRPYRYQGGQPVRYGPGWCQCGCGQRAPISTRTDARYGAVKGRPRRYVFGHKGRDSERLRVS